MSSTLERGLSVVLQLLLALFVAMSVHNFFLYIDHYPYWSFDDGLAVISNSLLQAGRYGDPSLPVEPLLGVQRYRGFFIYGPWYFFTGAGLVWLFGFSVKLLRSLHLLAALSLVLIGTRLFTGLRGAIATTIVGVGACYAVTHIQWPMVRPDPFVTLFAAGAMWAAARAAFTGRDRYWFATGLAAGCGAFSHLAGGSLIPASLATLIIALRLPRAAETVAPSHGAFARGLAALAGGWCISALMFYGSFGFRVKEQLSTILLYRTLVRTDAASAMNSAGPIAVWRAHYRIATSGVDGLYVLVVGIALVVATILIVRSLTRSANANALETAALIVPGWTIFVFYALGLGLYQNFHTGYVMLPQLVGIWVVASTLYVALGEGRMRLPSVGRIVEIGVAAALVVLVARLTNAESRSDNHRNGVTRSWIKISSYVNEVLDPVPERAAAWGYYPFAAEGPQRIQLISFETAARVMARVPPDRRPGLAPDFLIWGHRQNMDAVMFPETDPDNEPVTLLRTLLPKADFWLASLTSGAPYGTTRVYARRFPGSAASAMPLVNVWDADLQRWLHRAEPIADVEWAIGKGSLHIVTSARKWTWEATDSVVADLPSGWHLIRALGTGEPRSRQMLTAGSSTSHDFPMADLPPPIDVAVRLAPEPAYLLVHHEGGPLGINLFAAEPGARLGAVETFRVFGLEDYRAERERIQEKPLPELSQWEPDTPGGVTASRLNDALTVHGNASAAGYQLVSPPVPMRRDTEVMIRLPIVVDAGEVCTGVLDEQRSSWVVPPVDRAEVHRFVTGGNAAVFVVVANCHTGSAAPAASRFTVSGGRYTPTQEPWYTDALMRFW